MAYNLDNSYLYINNLSVDQLFNQTLKVKSSPSFTNNQTLQGKETIKKQ